MFTFKVNARAYWGTCYDISYFSNIYLTIFNSYFICCCQRNLARTVYGLCSPKFYVMCTPRVLWGSYYNIRYNINICWVVFLNKFNDCYRRALRKVIDSLRPPVHVSYLPFWSFMSFLYFFSFLPFLLW